LPSSSARFRLKCQPSGAALALLLALALPANAPLLARAPIEAGKPQTGLRVVPLSITAGGKTHGYKVEVAETSAQQAHGMMFRTGMAPATGMIFPMKPPRSASFWMENTLIPLDLVFIGADGKVRNIVADAVPHSQAPLSSFGPVAAVLELKGGEAARIGVKPGDKVIW
jgi:uncharacterized membrane protein (UPF0127 family)